MNDSDTRFTLKVLGAFTLLLLVAMTAGCSTLQAQFEEPTVKLDRVALLEAGFTQQVYGITLQVDNPNAFALPIKVVNYNVRLSEIDFASGATSNPFNIPANGSDTIDLEVRTNLIDSISQLAQLLRGGTRELDYQVSGDIHVNLPLIKAVPFSRTGTIPLQMRAGAATQ